MNLLGNIIWLIFGGLIAALAWVIVGVILCITIIGIPFGLQFFKLAKLVLWPFGKKVEIDFDKHPILNIIWILTGALPTVFGYLLASLLFAITIIGIPFAKQWFKLAKLALIPFGAKVN